VGVAGLPRQCSLCRWCVVCSYACTRVVESTVHQQMLLRQQPAAAQSLLVESVVCTNQQYSQRLQQR
jgi:hypothetical protein